MKELKAILFILLVLLSSCSLADEYFKEDFYNITFEVWGTGGAILADINWQTKDGSANLSDVSIVSTWKEYSNHIFEGQVCLDATNKSGVGIVYVRITKEHYVLTSLSSYSTYVYDATQSGVLQNSDILSASSCFDV